MKITLKKNWKFTTIGGKGMWKKGMVLLNDRRVKYLNHAEGFLVSHFYGYGQNEIVPLEILKIQKN